MSDQRPQENTLKELPEYIHPLQESKITHNMKNRSVNETISTTFMNDLDDMLQETFARKKNLTEAHQSYLDQFLAAFQEKVILAKQKRRIQKQLIEQLAKIQDTNADLERKNLNLDKDLLNETRR